MSNTSSRDKITVKQLGSQGPRGFAGWTPVIVQIADGNRLVNLLQSYEGGTGVMPITLTNRIGKYQKADGTWTSNIAQAFDINSGGAANAALATTKANEAQAFAANAGTMAANAAGSANTATTKANEAVISANNAATANTNAQTAKTAAETAATTATTKAAEALNSANQSAASAASSSAVALGVSTGRNSISPSILLDFANTQQLDSRLVFTRASTATYFDRTGVLRTAPANVPRFDFEPETGESLGLLIEESRTNLNPVSENDVNFGGLVIGDQQYEISNKNSPYGVSGKVYKGTLTAVGNRFQQNIQHTSNSYYTASIFIAKTSDNRRVKVVLNVLGITTISDEVIFNSTSGAVINSSGSYTIKSCGNFWRIELSCTNISDNTLRTIVFQLYPQDAAGVGTIGSSVEWFGYQLESSSLKFATSYIPTFNSVVTRAADLCQFSPSLFNIFSKDEGSVLAIYKKLRFSFYNRLLGTNLGTAILSAGGSANQAGIFDGVNDVYSISQTPRTDYTKVVTSWKTGGTKKVSVDNSVPNSSQYNTFSAGVTNILIGYSASGQYFLNSTIKKIAYYPKQLSDTEMRELTTVKLSGETSNQLPSVGDLGGSAFMQIRSLLAMRMRSELNYNGTGAQVSYTIRRPYAFTLAVVNSNGSTTTTLPTANSDGTYTADTNYTLLHNAPVGTTLTLEIIPVLY